MAQLIAIDKNPGFAPKELLHLRDRLSSHAAAFETWAQEPSKAKKVPCVTGNAPEQKR